MIKVYSKRLNAMTMPFDISLASADRELAERLLDEVTPQVQDELKRLENKFSPFKETSDLSRYRSGDQSVLLDAEFQEVFGLARLIEEQTSGFFDSHFDGQFNPTGFVKGWIVQKIFYQLIEPLLYHLPIEAVAFNGSGDMQVASRPYSDFTWKVGIENPAKTSQQPVAFNLANGGLATSGFSKRARHIKTDQTDMDQLTIIDRSLVWADAWATAGLVAGREKFNQLIAQHRLSGLYVTGQTLHFFHQGELTHVQEI